MNYFLDTCVELGYVFCTDPWNDKSVKVFDETDYLHYSYCVDREFDKKYQEGIFKCICTTNLIYAPEELKTREWYLQADMVPYIGRIIDALNTDESIYDLINSTSRLQDLASQMKISDLIDEDDTETI